MNNLPIRELRKHIGKSQQAFATRLGISIRALSNYENGRMPKAGTLHAFMCEAHNSGRDDLTNVFYLALQELALRELAKPRTPQAVIEKLKAEVSELREKIIELERRAHE